jgi:hypothetical protein
MSSLFCNHSATSFAWKGRSPRSRLRFSNSAISPAVLGFLISFSARKMCSLRRRLEFGIFLIAASPVPNNWHLILRFLSRLEADTHETIDHRVFAGSNLGCTDGPSQAMFGWFG